MLKKLAVLILMILFGGICMAEAASNITEGATAVTFQNGTWKMAGNLYLPKGYQQGKSILRSW